MLETRDPNITFRTDGFGLAGKFFGVRKKHCWVEPVAGSTISPSDV
jgi:hypothetical protein